VRACAQTATSFSILGSYAGSMRRIITSPGNFFREYAEAGNAVLAVFALAVSSIFYAIASLLMHTCPQPLAAVVIFFINAWGMPLLAAAAGFILSRFFLHTNVGFPKFLGIYAWAASAVLLAAWIPYLVLFTEVWRWWLIGVGLIGVCGMKRWQAVMVVAVTLALMIGGYGFLTGQWL